MDRYKLKKKLKFIFICLLFVIWVSGCSDNTVNDTEFINSFLTEVFTLNKDDRYTNFNNTVINSSEDLDAAVNTYYLNISSFLTDDCLSELKKNRIPLKYDIEAEKEDAEIKSVKISISDHNDDKYTFELSLITTNSDNSFNGKKFSGYIIIVKNDKGFLVDDFYVTADNG